MHYNSVTFFRAYQVHPIENGIFSVSPHVIFSAYEIIQISEIPERRHYTEM